MVIVNLMCYISYHESWKNIIVVLVSKETKSYAFSPSCVTTKKQVFVKTQGRKELGKRNNNLPNLGRIIAAKVRHVRKRLCLPPPQLKKKHVKMNLHVTQNCPQSLQQLKVDIVLGIVTLQIPQTHDKRSLCRKKRPFIE